jgi:hypothetical protein
MEAIDQTRAPVAMASSATELLRPFYFIVVVWGERFRNFFLELCLPTLLSARNIPALSTRARSKFLLCTRPEDWAAMRAAPIFQLLERYVDPVYLEIPACPAGTPACLHMGIGHRRACELAHAAKAYAFVLTPDVVFSDGTVERLQGLARQGMELALVPALRFAEEPLFAQLQQQGTSWGQQSRGEPISMGNRELVRAALASMHSETRTYEWDATCFNHAPSAVWWRVPGEDGIVLHSLSWAPLLLDFAAVARHDISTFDDWTLDGDYVFRNLGQSKHIHLVSDSDEIFMASWAPSSDRPRDLRPQWLLRNPLLGGLVRQQRFNAAFYGGSHDPLKQNIFFTAVRWHVHGLNATWAASEKHALRTLLSCVTPPSAAVKDIEPAGGRNRFQSQSLPVNPRWLQLRIRSLRAANVLLRPATRCFLVLRWLYRNRKAASRHIEQMVQGNAVTWKRTGWRIRQGVHYLLGRRFNEPEPGI